LLQDVGADHRRGKLMVPDTLPPQWCPEIAANRQRAKVPENSANIALSGQNGKIINGSVVTQFEI
jgi:hypothetical protein